MWYELWIVTAFTAAAFLLGTRAGARTRRRAEMCCLVSILTVFTIALLHFLHRYTLFSALDFITVSRSKFALLACALAFGLGGGLAWLDTRWKRLGTIASLSAFLYLFIGLPFLIPAAIQDQTRALPLFIDEKGFCIQSMPYTCGPAAAVSALGRFDITTREGLIALDSRTAPILGTNMWDLYKTLENICQQEKIDCSYRRLADLSELPRGSVALASIRTGFLVSHCVTILNVTDHTVTLVDPAIGLRYMNRPHFESQWYRTAIILTRPPATQLTTAQPANHSSPPGAGGVANHESVIGWTGWSNHNN